MVKSDVNYGGFNTRKHCKLNLLHFTNIKIQYKFNKNYTILNALAT